MVIYIHGCGTCGKTGRQIRRVLAFCREQKIDLEIKYSTHDPENQSEHLQLLQEAGLPTNSYTAIVVDNGKVTRLSEWNS